MSAYVTKPISTCERVSRALSALLSELHFPTRALGPITEARDLLLRAALDANEFYSTERDELTRDVAKLRADLAAAVAERDGLGDYRSEFEPIWDGLQDALEGERQINNYGLGESEVECVRRVLRERDILRARLAEYADAPTVGYAAFSNGRAYGLYFDKLSSISAEYSQVDLIVRPEAK